MKLNPDQVRIAEFDSPGPYAVKGVAGSGKTSIGIHRAGYLMKNRCPDADDRVLLLTYNRSLFTYLGYQYEKFSASMPTQLTLDSPSRDANQPLEINTVSQKMHENYIAYKKQHGPDDVEPLYFDTVHNEQRNFIFGKAIENAAREFPGISILDEKHHKFLINEIKWLKSSMLWTEKEYLEANRKIVDKNDGGGFRLPKNSETRKAIFALHKWYRDLLREYRWHDYPDTEAMGYIQASRDPLEQYTHVIVDESQDLSRLQLKFLHHIRNAKPYGTLTFLYDTSQSIYETSWLAPGNSFASVGFPVQGKTRYLRRNYRTSNEILSTARNMMSADRAWDEKEPFYCNQTGIRPILTHCNDQVQQDEEILDLILKLQEKFSLRDIAITCRYRKDLQRIENLLSFHGIESEQVNRGTKQYSTETVKLMTFHAFKGLESEVVIIPELVDDHYPYIQGDEATPDELFQERKLLYVAMTRASRMLFMFSHGTACRFLGDIDSELVKTVDLSSINKREEYTEQPVADDSQQAYNVPAARQLSLFQQSAREADSLKEQLKDSKKQLDKKSINLEMMMEILGKNSGLIPAEEQDARGVFEGVLQELDKKKKENEQLSREVTGLVEELEKLREHSYEGRNMDQWMEEIRERYPALEGQLVQSLSEAEFLREILLHIEGDYTTPYTVYTRVLEKLLHAGSKSYGIKPSPTHKKTLGYLFGEYMKIDECRKVLLPFQRARVIEVRNHATHGGRVKKEELEDLHDLLFRQNALAHVIELVT